MECISSFRGRKSCLLQAFGTDQNSEFNQNNGQNAYDEKFRCSGRRLYFSIHRNSFQGFLTFNKDLSNAIYRMSCVTCLLVQNCDRLTFSDFDSLGLEQISEPTNFFFQLPNNLPVSILVDNGLAHNLLCPVSIPSIDKGYSRVLNGPHSGIKNYADAK